MVRWRPFQTTCPTSTDPSPGESFEKNLHSSELSSGSFRTELRTEFRSELQTSIQELRTETAAGFAEMREYVGFSVKSLRDELRVHFDLTAEGFRSDFRNLYDWTLATATSLAARVDALEKRDATG